MMFFAHFSQLTLRLRSRPNGFSTIMDSQPSISASAIAAELMRLIAPIANKPARIAYTIDDAAAATGLTRPKIEGAINRGELPAKLRGNTLLISAESLRKWVSVDG
jgi:excisionase family DNA binding protein